MNKVGLEITCLAVAGFLVSTVSGITESGYFGSPANKKSSEKEYFGGGASSLKTTYIPKNYVPRANVRKVSTSQVRRGDVVVTETSPSYYNNKAKAVPVSMDNAAAEKRPEQYNKRYKKAAKKRASSYSKPKVESNSEDVAGSQVPTTYLYRQATPYQYTTKKETRAPMPGSNIKDSSSSDRDQLALLPTKPQDELAPQGKPFFESDGDFPVRFHPHLGIQHAYDDNFLTRADNPVGDFIWTISPGFTLEFGKEDPDNPNYDRILIGYTASIYQFMDETENNTVEQDASLQLRKNFEKLTLFLDHRTRTLQDTTLDANVRVDRDLYDTMIGAQYDFSDKTSFEVTAAQLVTNYAHVYSDKYEWIIDGMMNYKVLPKVTIGIGPRVGFLDTEGSENQTYEQALVRVLWQPTMKLAFNVTGGWEFRQWQDGAVDDRDTGTISAGANWYPFDGTKFGVEIFRGTKNSASRTGDNFVSTGFTALARQRFFQQLFLEVQGGYQENDYYSASTQVFTPRDDRYFTVKPALTWAFAEWGNVSVSYQYRDNESNLRNQEFENNIYAIEANFRY